MDALLDAILAAPDDDDPRLVWADAVGGERGELVVVQCRLARTEDSDPADAGLRAERHRLIRRQDELLAKNGETWAALPGVRDFEFRRGFVERVDGDLETFRALPVSAAPLANDLQLWSVAESTNRFAGPFPAQSWKEGADALFAWLAEPRMVPVRALRVPAGVDDSGDWNEQSQTSCFGDDFVARLAARPLAAELRELSIEDSGLTLAGVESLRRFPKLERLYLSDPRLGAQGAIALLRALPGLRGLALLYGEPELHGEELDLLLAAPEIARLESLDLFSRHFDGSDLRRLAECPRLAGLRRLHAGTLSGGALPADTVAALARSPHLAGLRELGFHGTPIREDAFRALSQATFAPRLRSLDLKRSLLGPVSCAILPQAFPALERLDLYDVTGIRGEAASLKAAIPEVLGRFDR